MSSFHWRLQHDQKFFLNLLFFRPPHAQEPPNPILSDQEPFYNRTMMVPLASSRWVILFLLTWPVPSTAFVSYTGRPAAAPHFVVVQRSSRWSTTTLLLSAVNDEKTLTSSKTDVDTSTLQGLEKASTSTQARNILDKALTNQNGSSLYKSISIPPGASAKGISDGDLAIQTRMVNRKYKIMDLIELSGDRDADRVSLALLCIMVGSTLSALVANQNLPGPDILRFLVVWLFSFAPLFFVGYGIYDTNKLQGALVSVQRNFFPVYRQRMLQHEAGHFLMGHLLGWPVAGYTANAVKNAVEFYPLSDTDRGSNYARQLGFDANTRNDDTTGTQVMKPVLPDRDVPYYSKEGRGQELVEMRSVFREAKNYSNNPMLELPSQNDPSTAWPYRGFSDDELDKLAVVSVAGVCAEILAFGNAEGGVADINQLRQIFNAAEMEMTDREIDNRIRYAIGYTISQLRRHLGALDALAAAMERDASVAECVVAIEKCENISGQDRIVGDYELRRRKDFQSQGWVEKLLLGGDRNIDTTEDRIVEGRGGGYRKESFRLTGDDPLYLAVVVSLVFVVWASSGGLSLH